MARFNQKTDKLNLTTNLAGGAAYGQSSELAMVSLLLTSFVQNQYYRSAEGQMADLAKLVDQVAPEFAAKAAIYARTEFGMRSITHVLAAALAQRASGKPWAKSFYNQIIHRPDDMLEIAAIVKDVHKKPLPNAMKKGFAKAFDRFDAYHLAKYRGESRAMSLVDLVNLVHPRPIERNAEALRTLVADELRNTTTWEAQLTKAGQAAETEAEKKELKGQAWADLLAKNKLGYLALLRNLRNIMHQAPDLVPVAANGLRNAHQIRKSLVFPFQLLTAHQEIQKLHNSDARLILEALNDALELSLANVPRFEGSTLVVVDTSGSMTSPMRTPSYSGRSVISMAAVFAAVLYKSNQADLMQFSHNAEYMQLNSHDSVMSLAQMIQDKAIGGSTNFHAIFQTAHKAYDRIIILSDMQGYGDFGGPDGSFCAYKKRVGANPFVYSWDLAGYGSLQLPEDKVFATAGFSDRVFDSMKMLEQDRTALVKAIEAVPLEG